MQLPSPWGTELNRSATCGCGGLWVESAGPLPRTPVCFSLWASCPQTLPSLPPDAKAPAAAPTPGTALTAAGKAWCPEALDSEARVGAHQDNLNPSYPYLFKGSEAKVKNPAETRGEEGEDE